MDSIKGDQASHHKGVMRFQFMAMDSRAMTGLVIILLFCVVLIGVRGGRILSREEDLELERQLKLINKPPIKTYQSKSGDVIDCIDINKQPAFDHPLLKNHTIQRTPSYYSKGSSDELMLSDAILMVEIESARCPPETIPIKRTTKQDLITFKSSLKFGGKYLMNAHPLNYTPSLGYHWAIVQSNVDMYHGADGWLNVYDIPQVQGDQYSGAAVSLNNGIEAITVGWMVNPALYGDSVSRLTILWTTDGYQNVNCYNQHCPGFVQTNANIPLGAVLSPSGVNQYLPVFVYKDKYTGDWWVAVKKDEVPIGYWPKSLFISLKEEAAVIQEGGLVYSPPSERSPPMGDGQFPSHKSAHVARIHFLDVASHPNDPRGNEDVKEDRPDCYSGISPSYDDGFLQWHFFFGGPGGC